MPSSGVIVTPVLPTLTSYHEEAQSTMLGGSNLVGATSAVWPSASLAIYSPVRLTRSISVDRMFTGNGATAADSIDVGLYAADGTRLASTGLTLQSGTNDLQLFSFAAVVLGPGVFYLAMAMNGTTGTIFRSTVAAPILKAYGFAQEDLSGAGTPGTLPATATFAAMTNTSQPIYGLVRTGFTI